LEFVKHDREELLKEKKKLKEEVTHRVLGRGEREIKVRQFVMSARCAGSKISGILWENLKKVLKIGGWGGGKRLKTPNRLENSREGEDGEKADLKKKARLWERGGWAAQWLRRSPNEPKSRGGGKH